MIGNFNAEMLVLARQARGLTLQELAERIGVSEGMVSKWEHEIAVPGLDNQESLASALHLPASFFRRPERVRGSDSICFHYKKRKTMPAKPLGRVEGRMHLAQLQVKSLLDDVKIEGSLEFHTLDPDEHGGPAGVAQTLRAFWRIPSGSIPNLFGTVEAAGAVVVLRSFGSRKLDGMSCWAKGTPPLFFLNSDLPIDRLRWTLAHELGHLTMHTRPPDDDPEDQAEEFAREFLLPMAETAGDLKRLTFQRLPALKQQWRVPMKEIITSATRRHLLPANKVKSISVQYSRAGWNSGEPFPIADENPGIVSEAVRVHLRHHGYTSAELAAVATMLLDEFEAEYGSTSEGTRRLRVV